MIVFFGLMAAFGLVLILLDFAAYLNDITPSLYRFNMGSFGILLIVIGGIGAGCVAAFG
jgi:hypothetical protein